MTTFTIEVPALDDKKALYVALRPEQASDIAKHIKDPKCWARADVDRATLSKTKNLGEQDRIQAFHADTKPIEASINTTATNALCEFFLRKDSYNQRKISEYCQGCYMQKAPSKKLPRRSQMNGNLKLTGTEKWDRQLISVSDEILAAIHTLGLLQPPNPQHSVEAMAKAREQLFDRAIEALESGDSCTSNGHVPLRTIKI
ncbi:hypothetical protein BDR04DRAFT_1157460 [Suillus decipiens]|nr:hypothetical protein BDR04DRAFT_1157460 [Suillus decipiens]